jgi:hypothetical protein
MTFPESSLRPGRLKDQATSRPGPGLILNRLIGESAQVEVGQVEAHYRLSHEEEDHLLSRIDPIVGLRRSGPAELASRTGALGCATSMRTRAFEIDDDRYTEKAAKPSRMAASWSRLSYVHKRAPAVRLAAARR